MSAETDPESQRQFRIAGRFIAVVGPSGVGKDSVMQAIATCEPRTRLARRVITRPRDQGGEDYKSVTTTEFNSIRDAGGFALWWTAHDLNYGIPVEVDDILARGNDVLANLSRGILSQAHARFPDIRVLSLGADRAALAERLAARGRENAAQIAKRLERADYTLPDSIATIDLDNSGSLDTTVRRALEILYPVRA